MPKSSAFKLMLTVLTFVVFPIILHYHSLSIARKVYIAFPSHAPTCWSVPPMVLITLPKYRLCELLNFTNKAICLSFITLVLSLLILNPTKAATFSKHRVFYVRVRHQCLVICIF